MESMDPRLYDAATIGDLSFLGKIRNGEVLIDLVSQKTPKDNNILHIAAEFKQMDFFKEVKSHHPQSPRFWATNKNNETPLHVAARVGCDEIVKFIIVKAKCLPIESFDPENGPIDDADMENRAADDEERGAANEGNRAADDAEENRPVNDVENRRIGDGENEPNPVEPYKKLLRMKNLEKDTALHVAVRYGHDGVVTLIIKADPELCCFTNRANESPLFLAVRKGSPSIIRDILKESPSDISPPFQGTNGMTALHAAVTRRSLPQDIVESMVAKNSELIKKADRIGWTPLHYAALRGNLKATQVLIEKEKSACYILNNELRISALHVAAYAGRTKILEEIIQRQPDTCDLVNHKGQTALHAAVVGDQIDVIKYVLKTPKLARLINQADNDGNTPYHLAAICHNRIILRLLSSDRRLDTTAINKNQLMVNDIVVDKIERKEDTNSGKVMKRLGRPFVVGVESFQQQIIREFKKLETPEEEAAMPMVTHNSDDGALKSRDTKLVVATLIATVTFTASINVPGGLKTNGRPVAEDMAYFIVFQFCNSLAFMLSIFVIFNESTPLIILSTHLPTPPRLIQYSIAGMFIAFGANLFSTWKPKRHSESLFKYLFGTPVDLVLVLIFTICISVIILIPIYRSVFKITRRERICDLRNHVI